MSSSNPYAPAHTIPADDFGIRKVKIKPIGLLKRGYELITGQYWLFLGIVVVAILIGSAVPFGIIMGPMIVGVFLCYIDRERGQPVEFGTVFKGFDQFVDALVACLMMVVIGMAVMLPFMIAMFVIIFMPIIANAANNPNAPPPPPQIPIAFFIMYPIMLIANVAVTLPFLFTFQLIADRKLKAMPAIKASARGVLKNLGGILWFMIVMWIITLIAMMMCYFPAFLLMPISFGALFVLYRDIYGPPSGDVTAELPIPEPLGPSQGI